MASIITRLQTKFEEITGDIFYSDPQQHFGEPKTKAWIEQVELDDDTLILYLKYWTIFIHEEIKKEDAIAGRQRKNKTSGEDFAAEIQFIETSEHETTVPVIIHWNGGTAKAAFSIEDGEVGYISDYMSEEETPDICCKENPYVYCSPEISDEMVSAINSLMETVRVCLEHVVEDGMEEE